MQRAFSKAFSLVELIVVISIVAIAAAIAIPVVKTYRDRAAFGSLYPFIDSQLAYWKQLYDSNSPLFNQVQSGHFQVGVFVDNPGVSEFSLVRLNHQPGCGTGVCSYVSFVFTDNSFPFAPGGSEARLLYVPAISEGNTISWSCRFNSLAALYGGMSAAEAIATYFPQCTVG